MNQIEEDNKIFDIAWNLYHTTPYSIKDCVNAVRMCGIDKEEKEYIDYLKLHNNLKNSLQE